jgi:hypothetical protein
MEWVAAFGLASLVSALLACVWEAERYADRRDAERARGQ